VIAASMEDERMMHPLLQVPQVNLSPLTKLIERMPGLRLVLINALQAFRGDPLHRLLSAGEVYVDIAMLEGIGGIEKLLADVPLERVLFGSHAPSFYFEAAQLKLQESQLSAAQRSAITQENARRLLPLA
jgi:predicted TIM-barrel fold metal-dependent hydrolase